MLLSDLRKDMKVIWENNYGISEGYVAYVNHDYGVFKIIIPECLSKDGGTFRLTLYDPLFLSNIRPKSEEPFKITLKQEYSSVLGHLLQGDKILTTYRASLEENESFFDIAHITLQNLEIQYKHKKENN